MVAKKRFSAITVLAAALAAITGPAIAQQLSPSVAGAADANSCIAAPTPACAAELAIAAALVEPEGWAITGAFEAFLAADPSLEGRERWMARYEAWAATATIDGIRERIVPVRAEHLARTGDFAGAYRELGLDKPNPDTLSEPSVIILDEARAGRVRDALSRLERLVERDSQDDLRLEILEIAFARAPNEVDAAAAGIRGRDQRRLAQALLAGGRGDAAIAPLVTEWSRGARAGANAPFDDPDTARKEYWDAFLRGAIAANNFASFRSGVAARAPYETALDAENLARILRPLMRDGRSDWIRAIGPAIRIPREESVGVDEEVSPMRALPLERIVAVGQAADAVGTVKGAMVDITVEILAGRGDVVEARDLFISGGRLAELNRVSYDQDRVAVVFETLWRAIIGRGPQADADAFAARITSPGARAFIARVAALRNRLADILAGNKGDEPADDEWAIILDLAVASGDFGVMTKTAAAIRDPGLRSTAFVQVTRAMWERASR